MQQNIDKIIGGKLLFIECRTCHIRLKVWKPKHQFHHCRCGECFINTYTNDADFGEIDADVDAYSVHYEGDNITTFHKDGNFIQKSNMQLYNEIKSNERNKNG